MLPGRTDGLPGRPSRMAVAFMDKKMPRNSAGRALQGETSVIQVSPKSWTGMDTGMK